MGCYASAFHGSLPLRHHAAAFALRVAEGVGRRAAALGGPSIRRFVEGVRSRTIDARTNPHVHRLDAAAWPPPPGPAGDSSDLVMSVVGTLGAGGAERQLALYLAESTRRGLARHELVSMRRCEGADAHNLPRLLEAGIPIVHRGEHADPAALGRLRGDTALRARLRMLPSGLRRDVVDLTGEFLRARPRAVHAWMDHANVLAGIAALSVGVPNIVLSLRSLNPSTFPLLHRAWMLPWYRVVLADPRVRLVANSGAGAASYAGWLGIDPARIKVVLNGVDRREPSAQEQADAARVRASLVPGGGTLVIGMMRLTEEKRPLLFAEIARSACAADPAVTFALAGDGPLRDAVRAETATLGARFRLLGTRSDAAAVLGAADVVLLTSRAEGTPNVLLEAQSLGVAVVATRVGGVPDAVDDGRTGVLCDPGDAIGLLQAVVGLLADPSRRAGMAAAGPGWIAERFSVDAMVEATDALYAG